MDAIILLEPRKKIKLYNNDNLVSVLYNDTDNILNLVISNYNTFKSLVINDDKKTLWTSFTKYEIVNAYD